jgi:hypothetical protein
MYQEMRDVAEPPVPDPALPDAVAARRQARPGFPCFAEDNGYVYATLLGLSESERRALEAEDAI